MKIRLAKLSDLEQIFWIYKLNSVNRARLKNCQYRSHIQKNGFLLGLDNKKVYRKLITSAVSFFISEDKGKILGYIIANKDKDYKDNKFKIWFDSALKKKYYQNYKSVSIFELVVAKENKQKGVASKLFEKLVQDLRKKSFKYLFSIVTISPLTNCPSIIFHEKNGFQRVGVSIPTFLFHLNDYSSILYGKKI